METKFFTFFTIFLLKLQEYQCQLTAREECDFVRNVLRHHNYLRSHHDADFLRFDSSLTQRAYKHINKMINDNDYFFKSWEDSYEGIGQNNLYIQQCTNADCCSAEKVVSIFYKEIEFYSFDKHISKNERQDVLNFQQMIWKETSRIGIARKISKLGKCFVVFFYYPSSDNALAEEIVKNVKPRKDSKNNTQIKWSLKSNSRCLKATILFLPLLVFSETISKALDF